ncbi:MAG: hypothetical protein ACI9KE_003501, partial [Polyangiales bacterium]
MRFRCVFLLFVIGCGDDSTDVADAAATDARDGARELIAAAPREGRGLGSTAADCGEYCAALLGECTQANVLFGTRALPSAIPTARSTARRALGVDGRLSAGPRTQRRRSAARRSRALDDLVHDRWVEGQRMGRHPHDRDRPSRLCASADPADLERIRGLGAARGADSIGADPCCDGATTARWARRRASEGTTSSHNR